MKKKSVIAVLLILGTLFAAGIFVWWMRVPTRTYTNSEWFQSEEKALQRVEVNGLMKRMVLHARIDHFFAPAVEDKRFIYFDRAWLSPPHDVYLMFGLANRADDVVVYRGNLEDGRLLWKAANSRGP